jgi:UDP-N-acetyl-D-mannosaminuronate dehydrogenase
VVDRLERELGGLRWRSVGVLGYAYREDVKEDAFTVASRLIALLEERGASVYVHDPLYSARELTSKQLHPFDLADPPPLDAIVLQAGHREYDGLDFARFVGLQVVVDGRNRLTPDQIPPTVRYLGIGRGATRTELASANGVDPAMVFIHENGATV